MKGVFKALGFITLIMGLMACGSDDLKKAASISSKSIELHKDRTLGANLLYSDSAKVKAQGFAPILDKVTPSDGSGEFHEMPKGVKIQFYDIDGQLSSTVTSEYAIRKLSEQKTTLKKNVVVTDRKGNTFTSEELIWDEQKRMFYSDKQVCLRAPDGQFTCGINFSAPQDFSSFTLKQGYGEVDVKDGLDVQP